MNITAPLRRSNSTWAATASVWIVAAIVALAAAPGYVSRDGVVQWYDGRYSFTSGYLGHPPLMSVVWGLFDRVWPGPAPMLLLQLGLFAAALAFALGTARPRPLLAIVLAASILLQPYIFSNLARINKDVLGGSAVLLAFALIIPRSQMRWWPVVLAGGLIAMATLYRYQFAVAAPIYAWIVYRSSGALPALAGIASVAVTGFGLLGLVLIGPTPPSDVQASLRKIIAFDLAGIAVGAPGGHLDQLTAPGVDPAEIVRRMRDEYTTAKVDTLWDAPESAIDLLDRVPLPVMEQAWVQEVTLHPLAFVHHRLATFARVLGIGGMTECAVVSRSPTAPDPPELAEVLRTDQLPQPFMLQVLHWRIFPVDSFLFRPIFYVGLAVIGCAMSLAWRPRSSAVLWARWSLLLALAYWGTFLALPQACDGRYSFLPITLTMLVATLSAVTVARAIVAARWRPATASLAAVK